MKISNKLLTVLLLTLLTTSFVSSIPFVEAKTGTLISNITTLIDDVINWNDPGESNRWHFDVNMQFKAYVFNKISKAELESYLSSLTLPAKILYGYAQAEKYGIEDETTIKYALLNMEMMTNGLPTNFSDGSGKFFRLSDRYMFYGYYWAQKYSYETAKWDLNKAYANFKWAIDNAPVPAALLVYEDNDTYCYNGDTEPRFYDECAETLDCFLHFYKFGITEALDEALETWAWVNNNLWNVNYCIYRPSDTGFECESGGFLQIALKLQYYAPNAGNMTRTIEDMVTRYISKRWLSSQWSYSVVVHKNPGNAQRRMANTLMAWASIYGNYYNLTQEERANVTDLIKGYNAYDEAWQLLYDDSGLYNSTSGLFKEFDDEADRNFATGDAAMLLLLLGIIPGTGTLAMPLTEMVYQDVCNLFDKDILSIDVPTRTLRISILKPGTIDFQYGSSIVTYNFTQSGVYSVVFAADWNSISSTVKTSDLPTNRLYIGGGTPTYSDIGYTTTVAGILISLVTHTFVGPAILILWGVGYLTVMGKWLLGGFPQMLTMLGLPDYIGNVAYVIMAFAMFTLIIEVTAQRDLT